MLLVAEVSSVSAPGACPSCESFISPGIRQGGTDPHQRAGASLQPATFGETMGCAQCVSSDLSSCRDPLLPPVVARNMCFPAARLGWLSGVSSQFLDRSQWPRLVVETL